MLHTEKHYEGSHILFWKSGAHFKSLQMRIVFCTIYGGTNIW